MHSIAGEQLLLHHIKKEEEDKKAKRHCSTTKATNLFLHNGPTMQGKKRSVYIISLADIFVHRGRDI
jgi:hypothetical protein